MSRFTACLVVLFFLIAVSLHGQTVEPAAPRPAIIVAPSEPPTPPSNQGGPTLAAIRAAGALSCGVDFEEAEYSIRDAHGNHSAFDFDLCKAIAVAVLGPNARYNVVPYRAEEDALKGLKSGEIAVLATGSVNYMNIAAQRVGFARPVFYDFQGLLVDRDSNIHSSADLNGKKVCFLVDTEIESEIQGYLERKHIKWLPFPFSEEGEMEAALITHNCDAITADVTQLAYERIAFRGMATHFDILPEAIAKDPLAPAVRLDDPQWATTVDWVVEALIQAEESGITQANVAEMKQSTDPAVQRLLGSLHGYGQYLGLQDDWAANVVGAVGNYGEIFDRDMGPHSVMKLPRGANNLWTQGGLMIAEPIR